MYLRQIANANLVPNEKMDWRRVYNAEISCGVYYYANCNIASFVCAIF